MLQVPYTYKIVSVNEDLNLMEVEYSAEGYETVLVSMPLPFEDDDIEVLIAQYTPMYDWVVKHKKYKVPTVGVSGVIKPFVPEVPDVPELSEEDVMKMIEALKADTPPA